MINLHPKMRRLGAIDPDEVIDVTLMLRRRDDHPPFHQHVQRHEFIAKHGWHPKDEAAVRRFLVGYDLIPTKVDQASKQMEIKGKAKDVTRAFGVTFAKHHHPSQGVVRVHTGEPKMIPEIIAVLNLSTLRGIAKPRFAITPVNTTPLTIDQLKTLYSWPTNSAAGQVIGIFADALSGVHSTSDVALYFSHTGDTAPTIINVMPADTTALGVEANLDVMVAGSAAKGCTIAMYYSPTINTGDRVYTDPITRAVHPWPGDPNVTVFSISYGFYNNGDATDLMNATTHNALQSLFQDAAALGVTIIASAGDSGTGLAQALFGDPSDGLCYVVEPACNPYCLAVGGTVVGNVSGSSFEEYIWNTEDGTHATGGGVSQYFTSVPSYQGGNAVQPRHANTNALGRGIPDISGNASGASGVSIPVNGTFETAGGTSLTAPLMAGLIAVINASNGRRAGMIHPIIYAAANGSSYSSVFRDINASTLGPPNNATGGAPGYPAATGWDGSTGVGIPIGTGLQTAINNATASVLALSYSTGGAGSSPVPEVQGNTFAFTHLPIFTAGGNFVNVFVTGSSGITGVNNFSVTAPAAPGVVSAITPTVGATTIALEWLAPATSSAAPPPYTYSIKWGNSPSSLINSGTSTTPTFTISGLSVNQTIFGSVAAVGPTSTFGPATTFQANTQNTSGVVTNCLMWLAFVDNFITAVQWDDIGATSYYVDYGYSPTINTVPSTWVTTPESPYPTGYGATTPTVAGSSSPFPKSYPLRCVNSVHGTNVDPTVGGEHLCQSPLYYWVRIRAQYGDGSQTTSAPFGSWLLSSENTTQTGGFPAQVWYPNVAGSGPNGGGAGAAQSLSTGTINVWWDDIYPGISPVNGATITYQVMLSLYNAGTQTLGPATAFGSPFASGFGYRKGSAPGTYAGPFNTITGIPAGTYYVHVQTIPNTFGGEYYGGLSEPFDGADVVLVSGEQIGVTIVS